MIINGNALYIPLRNESVQCCITSPRYWGLRDYNVSGQLGMEQSPDEYVQNMVQVFREVWRVLRKDGTVFLNLGDTYAASRGYQVTDSKHVDVGNNAGMKVPNGLKPKDLVGIPWRVAFALQSDGWWLRSDIIWHKPNPMPESVVDRPTKSHEYVFLLTKSAKYYYDADAIKVPIKDASALRLMQNIDGQTGSNRIPGKTNGNMKAVLFGGTNRCPDSPGLQSGKEWKPKMAGSGPSFKQGHSGYFDKDGNPLTGITANKKSVWSITTQSFKGAHFATMPEKLVEPCILAGSRPRDVVLDPFAGSCTVGKVAERYNRGFVGIELNLDYIEIGKKRMSCNQMELAA